MIFVPYKLHSTDSSEKQRACCNKSYSTKNIEQNTSPFINIASLNTLIGQISDILKTKSKIKPTQYNTTTQYECTRSYVYRANTD